MKQKYLGRRIISIVLSIAMVFSLLSINSIPAYANSPSGTENQGLDGSLEQGGEETPSIETGDGKTNTLNIPSNLAEGSYNYYYCVVTATPAEGSSESTVSEVAIFFFMKVFYIFHAYLYSLSKL